MSNVYRNSMVGAALFAALIGWQAVFASTYIPIRTGTISAIDFLKHTVTVNEHVYRVSPKATYQGAQGFGVLSNGMKIEYFLENVPSGNPSVITRIIVLSQ